MNKQNKTKQNKWIGLNKNWVVAVFDVGWTVASVNAVKSISTNTTEEVIIYSPIHSYLSYVAVNKFCCTIPFQFLQLRSEISSLRGKGHLGSDELRDSKGQDRADAVWLVWVASKPTNKRWYKFVVQLTIFRLHSR